MKRRWMTSRKWKKTKRILHMRSSYLQMKGGACEVFVDGSSNKQVFGIVIVIITPTGDLMVHAFILEFGKRTNNVVEYGVVIHALWLIVELGVTNVRLTSNSQLMIRKIELKYSANDATLKFYMHLSQELASQIEIGNITFGHLCRKDNRHADALDFIS